MLSKKIKILLTTLLLINTYTIKTIAMSDDDKKKDYYDNFFNGQGDGITNHHATSKYEELLSIISSKDMDTKSNLSALKYIKAIINEPVENVQNIILNTKNLYESLEKYKELYKNNASTLNNYQKEKLKNEFIELNQYLQSIINKILILQKNMQSSFNFDQLNKVIENLIEITFTIGKMKQIEDFNTPITYDSNTKQNIKNNNIKYSKNDKQNLNTKEDLLDYIKKNIKYKEQNLKNLKKIENPTSDYKYLLRMVKKDDEKRSVHYYIDCVNNCFNSLIKTPSNDNILKINIRSELNNVIRTFKNYCASRFKYANELNEYEKNNLDTIFNEVYQDIYPFIESFLHLTSYLYEVEEKTTLTEELKKLIGPMYEDLKEIDEEKAQELLNKLEKIELIQKNETNTKQSLSVEQLKDIAKNETNTKQSLSIEQLKDIAKKYPSNYEFLHFMVSSQSETQVGNIYRHITNLSNIFSNKKYPTTKNIKSLKECLQLELSSLYNVLHFYNDLYNQHFKQLTIDQKENLEKNYEPQLLNRFIDVMLAIKNVYINLINDESQSFLDQINKINTELENIEKHTKIFEIKNDMENNIKKINDIISSLKDKNNNMINELCEELFNLCPKVCEYNKTCEKNLTTFSEQQTQYLKNIFKTHFYSPLASIITSIMNLEECTQGSYLNDLNTTLAANFQKISGLIGMGPHNEYKTTSYKEQNMLFSYPEKNIKIKPNKLIITFKIPATSKEKIKKELSDILDNPILTAYKNEPNITTQDDVCSLREKLTNLFDSLTYHFIESFTESNKENLKEQFKELYPELNRLIETILTFNETIPKNLNISLTYEVTCISTILNEIAEKINLNINQLSTNFSLTEENLKNKKNNNEILNNNTYINKINETLKSKQYTPSQIYKNNNEKINTKEIDNKILIIKNKLRNLKEEKQYIDSRINDAKKIIPKIGYYDSEILELNKNLINQQNKNTDKFTNKDFVDLLFLKKPVAFWPVAFWKENIVKIDIDSLNKDLESLEDKYNKLNKDFENSLLPLLNQPQNQKDELMNEIEKLKQEINKFGENLDNNSQKYEILLKNIKNLLRTYINDKMKKDEIEENTLQEWIIKKYQDYLKEQNEKDNEKNLKFLKTDFLKTDLIKEQLFLKLKILKDEAITLKNIIS